MTVPTAGPGGSARTGELLDGRYRLDEQVGTGGMGVVYRARDESLGRTVAVKVFHDYGAEASRTSSETRLLAALNHPSLVTLFDAQVVPDRPSYLVMEYVDGPTLRERLAQSSLSPEQVAVMARDLAEALHVVHDAGIVHRDIKPSNVLLKASPLRAEEYRAKLADFGIAYLVDTTRLTTPGTLVGTAAYLSPEQVRGSEPAPASDIYALGLVLAEALTGQRAFPQTGTHEAALARLSNDPEIPGQFGYSWKALLTAMTARDPEHRPSALEVVHATAGLGDDASGDPTETVGAPQIAATAVLPTQSEAATERMPAAAQAATERMPVAAEAATERMPVAAQAATERMPVAAEAATERMPAAAEAATERMPVAATERRSQSSVEPKQSRPFWRRWPFWVVLATLIVAAVVVGVLGLGVGTSDPDMPTLPALNEPLGTHMQELLESVTP